MPQKNLKKKIVNTKSKATQKAKTQPKQAATKKTVKTVSLKYPSKVIAAPLPAKKPVAKAAVKAPAPAKTPVAVKLAVKPADKKAAAATAKVPSLKMLYKVGNYVVYPTHGVGKIMAEETQMIGDIELRMLVISFEKDKMTLRVPLSRASAAGLRPVSSTEQMKRVFVTLKSRARTSRGMWSRRAQEYETKINSGNIHFIAEVVRDLHQNVDQSERSYSERMIYESALARLVGELAACEGTDYKTATDKLMKLLRAKVAAAAAESLKEAA
jgi:CarD family transcriptional regulator